MHAILFWSIMAASALLALVSLAWITAEENGLRVTDVGILVAPWATWFLLLVAWHHPKSLSNLIEPFALVPVVGICLAIRAFGFTRRSHAVRSWVALGTCILAALALYAFVPALPE